jgi:hypothetical protein
VASRLRGASGWNSATALLLAHEGFGDEPRRNAEVGSAESSGSLAEVEQPSLCGSLQVPDDNRAHLAAGIRSSVARSASRSARE